MIISATTLWHPACKGSKNEESHGNLVHRAAWTVFHPVVCDQFANRNLPNGGGTKENEDDDAIISPGATTVVAVVVELRARVVNHPRPRENCFNLISRTESEKRYGQQWQRQQQSFVAAVRKFKCATQRQEEEEGH